MTYRNITERKSYISKLIAFNCMKQAAKARGMLKNPKDKGTYFSDKFKKP